MENDRGKTKQIPFLIFSFSISKKIIYAFVIVSLLVGLASGFSYSFLKRMNGSYIRLLNDNSTILNQISEIQTNTQLQNRLLYSYLVSPSQDKQQQMNSVNTQLTHTIQQIAKMNSNREVRDNVSKMIDANATFKRLLKEVTDYMDQNQPELAKAQALLWSVPATVELTSNASKITELEKKNIQAETVANQQIVSDMMQMMIWISIVAIVFSIAVGFLLSRSIVRPIRAMVVAAEQIAACDLTEEDIYVKNRDETRKLATAFNEMKSNLKNVISHVGDNAKQVAAAAQELSATSVEVSKSSEEIMSIVQGITDGTEQQLHSVYEGVSLIEKMNGAIENISDATLVANEKAAHALETATKGDEAIVGAIAQMNSIQSKMAELKQTVERLTVRSSHIVKTVGVISEIADQTNLLALNASIEAARAGESGKGFAVVAEEVQKLSLQTSTAAKEVGHMIHSILDETSSVMVSTEAGNQEVHVGIKVVNHAGQSFKRIRDAVEEVACQIVHVLNETSRITGMSNEAVSSIRSIDQVAKQSVVCTREVTVNAKEQVESMEEITAASAKLNFMAVELQELISQFRI